MLNYLLRKKDTSDKKWKIDSIRFLNAAFLQNWIVEKQGHNVNSIFYIFSYLSNDKFYKINVKISLT